MTSKRRLKKEVDYLVSELVIDCMSYVQLHEKSDEKKAFKIIEDTLKIRNTVREQINHPDGKDNSKLVKTHYRKSIEKLEKAVEKGYEKLGKLTEGK